jgi:hypothetical protein
MWQAPPQIEWIQTGPWRFYNFAILHSKLPHILDTLRYEPAFIVRKSDLANLIDSANAELDFLSRRFSLLICKADDHGIKKASWWPQRLLSSQEFEYIEDHAKLYGLMSEHQLNKAAPDFHANPTLKWRGIVEITGTLKEVLTAMFENRAYPATEGDSHIIERAFNHPNEPMKVKIESRRASNAETFVNLPTNQA